MLRLQNVYGAGQSLTNPYTGIVSLFSQLARDGQSIPLYEDGEITRDFVYIDDVADALVAAIAAPAGRAARRTLDVGSGERTTIRDLAARSRRTTPHPTRTSPASSATATCAMRPATSRTPSSTSTGRRRCR